MATTDDFSIVLLNGGSDIPTPDDPADAKDINDAFKQIDSFLGVTVCTSGTRPPLPKYRQLIRETDTGRLLYWTGATWIDVVTNTPGLIPSGTAAQRDAYWGAPASATERVALANKAARWVNTDVNFGFEQRYFCPTTDSATPGYLAQNARGAGGWMTPIPFEKARFFRDTAAATVPTSLTDIPGFSLAVPCSGGKLRIRAEMHWVNPASGADRVVAIKAFNDGVEITPVVTQTLIPFLASASVGIMSNYVWEITPTAGTHTFKLQYNAAVASSVSLVSPSLMTVEEIPG